MVAATASFNLSLRRLGHPSQKYLQCLAKTVLDISISNNEHCDICPVAKQTRLSFPTSQISTNALQLIHCDIWENYQTPSLSSARFFLTIVNDFTQCTWVLSYAS